MQVLFLATGTHFSAEYVTVEMSVNGQEVPDGGKERDLAVEFGVATKKVNGIAQKKISSRSTTAVAIS